MLYLLIFVYLLLIPATILVMLYKILSEIEKIKEEQTKAKTTKHRSVLSKRRHTNISKSNYKDVFSGRNKAYDSYTTQKGLYEPVTPHKGVTIKKEV